MKTFAFVLLSQRIINIMMAKNTMNEIKMIPQNIIMATGGPISNSSSLLEPPFWAPTVIDVRE